MKLSIDKITVVGNIFGDLENFIRNEINLKYRGMAKYPYRDSFHFLDGSVLQVAEKEAVTSGKIKQLRYEFNPNNKSYNRLHMRILQLMKNVHLTRCDIAFDVYDVDMSTWRWIDSAGRKSNVWYGEKGDVETWYIGGRSSDMTIRIYNKAKEQGDRDKIWWRVEIQMRSKVAEGFYKYKVTVNPFEYVSPVVDEGYPELDIKRRAMVKYLIDNPSRFSELSVNTRGEYKRLIRGIGSWRCINFHREWEKKESLIWRELRDWLSVAHLE